ncbi:HTH domain-containing protein [Zhouia spongiae]|uniref:HTH domain-containing protein n=1 Tax=Zhouia spongiae TaxID=2202721 RepID=A0ABY3YJ69_9FLAO|nr:HTH domain-containing protein [Zhouia spongiae]UNY97748.1 HTH domain-containing protein [Zhouia spongiae]
MTFHKLAELVLKDSEIPLTISEIWEIAVNKGLDSKLNSKGKTPNATLGARLHVIARDNPKGIFKTVGRRPKRFYLSSKEYNIDFSEYEAGKTEEETKIITKNKSNYKYTERDLHHFLAHFAFYSLKSFTKTISHSKSEKKKFGEWVHPDMVGCEFPIDEWDDSVLKLSSSIGNTSIVLQSFEIKKELNLSTLREKFFQAVSNSSWANESYLVSAEISEDEEFRLELERLSSAFGIGVIHLDIFEPNNSKVILLPEYRENLDWETLNKLVQMNPDFKNFIKRIEIDLKSHEIRKEMYDKILEDEKLIKLIKNIS